MRLRSVPTKAEDARRAINRNLAFVGTSLAAGRAARKERAVLECQFQFSKQNSTFVSS